MMKNKSSYLFKHVQLTTFFCFHAIDKQEWGTKDQKNKIAFMAFFHDITLQRDELAEIETERELEQADLTNDDKEKVLTHALDSANIIRDFPKAPIGADTLIKQHHGSRSGTGFAEHFGDNISPLTITFIVCEAFANQVLKADGKINVKNIAEKLSDRFPSEKYSIILRSLAKLKYKK